MWPALRLGAAMRLGAARAFASGTTATPAPLAAIRARAENKWNAILDAEWVDNDSLGVKTEAIDKIVRDYRSLYNASEVESSAEASEVYNVIEQLYVVGEAAKIVELYADHIEDLMRHHLELTGFLGNNTALPPEDAVRAENTLKEYIAFANSIENNRIRRKVESQLGRKAILLRQVLSAEGFSAKLMPVATDHIVIRTTAATPVSSHPPFENTK